MRKCIILASAVLLSGCAFPRAVQRIGVEYNSAVAGMANELTLLNILRAKEDLPLHYTGVTRLDGSIIVKGGANVNGTFRANQTTDTDATATTTTTANDTVGTLRTVTQQILEGVDTVTPTVSGEVTTGPSFGIAIYDTQAFYQGILGAIPFSTVENYISQGYSDQLLMRLFVERIDFREETPQGAGRILFSWQNAPSGTLAAAFAENIECYRLTGTPYRPAPVDLVPVSRLRRDQQGNLIGLTLQEIALLDGRTLGLSDRMALPADDARVFVQRLSPEQRIAELELLDACKSSGGDFRLPDRPPPAQVYLGNARAVVLGNDGSSNTTVSVRPQMVFRSTESVIRFVGQYLREYERDRNSVPLLDGAPLFSAKAQNSGAAVVSTSLLGRRYAIVEDDNRRRNMQVIALIQQLVNLHKSASERPVTVPVRVLPGG